MHPMTGLSLLVALAGAATGAMAATATRSFPATGFDRVQLSGSDDVVIVTGKAMSVTAVGEPERLDRLRIDVTSTTLRIDRKSGIGWSSERGTPTRITVTLPELHAVQASGSGDIVADRGSGPAFSASATGSGDVRIGRVDSPAVAMRITGSGDITAAGRCSKATASVTGSGTLDLAGLTCSDVDVVVTGSGDVTVQATGTAQVRVTGSGNVEVKGAARCTTRSTGSGTIRCG